MAQGDSNLLMVHERNRTVAKDRNAWKIMAFLSGGALLLAFGVIGYLAHAATHVDREYFAQNVRGGLTRIYPLTEPYVAADKVREFASKAMVATFTYNFSRFKEEVDQLERFYTPEALANIKSELVRIGLLERIETKRVNSVAQATRTAIITNSGEGMCGNARCYKWRVEIPVMVTFEGETSRATQPELRLVVIVQRASELEKEEGIAVGRVEFN